MLQLELPAPPPSSMREHKPIHTAELVIVGCVRNGAKTLRHAVETLACATAGFAHVEFLVIESDSTDATLDELQRLHERVDCFGFISMGALAQRHPARTERVAACRNRYLDELRSNPRYASADYVMVADLDGVNSDLRPEAVQSCWRSSLSWDVCTANQRDGYYDIWALRNAGALPGLDGDSCMAQLKPEAEWIEVASAYGGLAIYRREALLDGRYSGVLDGKSICEHVPLHSELRAKGWRIFINPALINAHRTDHSARIRLRVRLRREIAALGERMRERWRR
jgi:hypothetical protein